LGTLLRLTLGLVLLIPPVIGAWVGSTLVAWNGASPEVATAMAVLLFAVLPLAWEVASRPRALPGGVRPTRLLRLHTRLLLRACVLHVTLLAAALLLSPRGVFTALAQRGDWMLPPGGDTQVQVARRLVFAAADCVEWAYVLATDNPYEEQLIAQATHPPKPDALPSPPSLEPRPSPAPHPSEPEPQPQPPEPQPPEPRPEVARPVPDAEAETQDASDGEPDVVIVWGQPKEPHSEQPSPEPEKPVKQEPRPEPVAQVPVRPGSTVTWPLPDQLHPRVTSIHRAAEEDYQKAAAYLVYGEYNPFQRIKALHDYVADRVAYDGVSYLQKKFVSPKPEDVFASRKAVCAGYANLFAAMAQSVGEEVVTLHGDALGFSKEPAGHAWNAVRIEGEWYLVDVTWNAGHIDATGTFTKRYRTHYLFTPPQEFARRHFPADPRWQLMTRPLSRGDFLRFAGGEEGSTASASNAAAQARADIRIRTPAGHGAEVRGRFPVELDNPQGLRTRVRIVNATDGSFADCPSEYGATRFACTVLGRGSWRVEVYASQPSETSEALVAQLDVTGT
jgi:transglutaminase-like putative cysteine protease